MRFQILLLVFTALLLVSCSSSYQNTNELANYDFSGKSVLYKTKVGRKARTVNITDYKSKNNYASANNKKSAELSILEAVVSVGQSLISADKEAKLKRMVHPKEMAESVTYGMKDAVETYLDIDEVFSIQEDPDFICEVTLSVLEIQIDEDNTRVYASAYSRMLDRATGKKIWDRYSRASTPVSENYDTRNESDFNSTAGLDAINIIEFASLDEETINELLKGSVETVGYNLGEYLRCDLLNPPEE